MSDLRRVGNGRRWFIVLDVPAEPVPFDQQLRYLTSGLNVVTRPLTPLAGGRKRVRFEGFTGEVLCVVLRYCDHDMHETRRVWMEREPVESEEE